MSWKSASFVVSWYLLHYCFYGVPVLTHNIINDYFFRFNCSITDNASFYTYNTIECASRCISDNVCEGFQAYKVSSKSTMCVLFNRSSSMYVSDLSRKTYIKRDLDEKVSCIFVISLTHCLSRLVFAIYIKHNRIIKVLFIRIFDESVMSRNICK